MALALRYSALSDLGRYRKDNQDSGYAGEHLLVIADGVGGAAYGDVASHTAVQIMRRLDEPPTGDLLEALAGTVHRVHDRLAELVEHDHELDGTSTTITAGLFDGSRLGVAHLGDSRAYLLRQGEVRRLTHDHTFVQTLVDEGRISEEESRSHPHRNLILRAVDAVHETEPDLFHVDLEAGDRLLFCSDGCSGVLDDTRMAELLGAGTVDSAAVELVRTALDLGTTDNVTVVVADVVDDQTPADADSAAAATGPMLVGAAAGQPRKLAGGGSAVTGSSRRQTGAQGDAAHAAGGHGTGALPPIEDEDEVDLEELRYALRAPRRLLWLRRLTVALVLLIALIALGKLAYDWSQEQYYVSADGDAVAIYRGMDFELPVVTMNRVVETTSVTMAALPPTYAQQVRDGIAADDIADARRIIDNAFEVATKCPEPEPVPPTSTPTGGATGGATGRPGKKATSTATPNPTVTASPTPTTTPPDCVEATP